MPHSVKKGILKPVLQNRWRLLFVGSDENTNHIISTQATDCSFNYVEKLLHLSFEQNESCDTLHKMFIDLAKTNNSCQFYVQTLDGNENITSSIKVSAAELSHHSFALNYASANSARHYVTFTVDSFESKLPDDSYYVTEFQLS